MVAGPMVGMADAVYVLTSGPPADYLALLYAVVLYAVVGLGLGSIAGVGLLLLGLVARDWCEPARCYSLAFVAVATSLAGIVASQEVDRIFYLDHGLPRGVQLLLASGLVLMAAMGLWLGPILLTRTPFKIVLRRRGTMALYGVLVLLSAVFSLSPVAGGDPAGWMSPQRELNPELQGAPNVLVLLVDSLRPDHLGCYGRESAVTPHIDTLASQGVLYERAFAQSNWSRGSVSSLLSSQLPSTHGVLDRRDHLDDSVLTLPEVLREHGLVTAALFNHPDLVRRYGLQQGFDWYPYLAPSFPLFASQSASQLGLYRLVRRFRARRTSVVTGVEEYYLPAAEVLDRGRHFVEVNRARRWFLVAHLMDGYPPLRGDSPEGSVPLWQEGSDPLPEHQRAAREAYAQAVTGIDEQVGALVAWLEEQGLGDDTMVVLTATHGMALGERDHWGTGRSLHDELLRIPLIIRLPGGELAGTRVRPQVRQIDLAPTVLEALGAELPEPWQGADLLDGALLAAAVGQDQPGAALDGAAPGQDSRVVLSESGSFGRVAVALRTQGWKLIRTGRRDPHAPAALQLFKVSRDPGESVDLAEREDATRDRLERMMMEEITRAQHIREGIGRGPLDTETSERLEALGYGGASAGGSVDGAVAPRD